MPPPPPPSATEHFSEYSDSETAEEEEEQTSRALISTMEARAESLKARNYRSIYTVATSLGIGLFIVVLVWLSKYRGGFAWSSQPDLEFNWHPLLMVTGLILIYGQSILLYRTAREAPKRRLKIAHATLNGLAFVLAVIGLKAVFDSHNYKTPPMPNLYSMHSWLGLITVICFAGQFFFGFVSFLFPGLSRTLRAAFLPVHTAIGTATFTLALMTSLMGFTEKTIWTLDKKYSSLPPEGVLVNFATLFTAFFGIMVLYLVTEPDFKRANLPEDEIALANSD